MLQAIDRTIRRVCASAGSVLGIRRATEEAAYTSERSTRGFEIRRYGPRIAAETIVSGSEEAARSSGFRRLAGYIFGGNHANTKIAMTAPVAQHASVGDGEKIGMTAPVAQRPAGPGEWVVRFFMPADKTMTSLPHPNDPAVHLVTVPAETVAVRRFSGRATPKAVAVHTAALLHSLGEGGPEPIGTPTAWFYDPPWTVPLLRRNEIAVLVSSG